MWSWKRKPIANPVKRQNRVYLVMHPKSKMVTAVFIDKPINRVGEVLAYAVLYNFSAQMLTEVATWKTPSAADRYAVNTLKDELHRLNYTDIEFIGEDLWTKIVAALRLQPPNYLEKFFGSDSDGSPPFSN